MPMGAHSKLVPDSSPVVAEGDGGDMCMARLRLIGTITAVDGQDHIEQEITHKVRSLEEAEELGAQVARLGAACEEHPKRAL